MRLADRNAQMARRSRRPKSSPRRSWTSCFPAARTASTVNQAAFDYEHRSALGVFDRVRSNAIRGMVLGPRARRAAACRPNSSRPTSNWSAGCRTQTTCRRHQPSNRLRLRRHQVHRAAPAHPVGRPTELQCDESSQSRPRQPASTSPDNCKTRRPAFTLFELILAIALSARSCADRHGDQPVPGAGRRRPHARRRGPARPQHPDDDRRRHPRRRPSIKPQDTSAIAKLMAAGHAFDVDSIAMAQNPGRAVDATAALGGSRRHWPALAVRRRRHAGSRCELVRRHSSMAALRPPAVHGRRQDNDDTMPLGINGHADELYVDVDTIPRLDELFATATGYTNAQPPATLHGAAARPPRPTHPSDEDGPLLRPPRAAAPSLAARSPLRSRGSTAPAPADSFDRRSPALRECSPNNRATSRA